MASGLHIRASQMLLMQSKEVGSIIGKKGASVKKMREESGDPGVPAHFLGDAAPKYRPYESSGG